jgi:hypothetical protein
MVRFDVEPSLDEVFSDPMIHVLMKRDRVDADDLRGFLQDMRSKLGARATPHALRAAAHQWMSLARQHGPAV